MSAICELDGGAFANWEEFTAHFSRRVLGGHVWAGNLDALNDILRGGFGTPEGGFTIRFLNSATAKQVLGHEAMARWLEDHLQTAHPTNREQLMARLAEALRGSGPTLFDEVVDIIRDHGPGGQQAEDAVFIELS
jgi:hypothetical protein